MAEFPSAVLNAFEKLKQTSDTALILRKLNGHYYVYRARSNWDKANKKVLTRHEYLGKITDRGMFIEKAESWADVDLKKALAVVQAHGGQVIMPQKTESKPALEQPQTAAELPEVDRRIRTILSMNARAPVSFIAKKTGLTRSVVLTKMRGFEKKYGIRYILEVDIKKLGFRPYAILAKFEGERPPTELLRKIVQNEPHIQFAAMLKGDYDLFMYWLDDIESLEIADDMWKFEANEALKGFNMRLDVTPFGHTYSFMPLREDFLEKVLKEKVWKIRGGRFSPKERELRSREYVLLKELNSNSVMDFAEIDKKYGLGRGASRYSYLDLKQRAIIVRSTISMENLPIKYTAMLMLETINAVETEETMYKRRYDIIEYGNLANKYVLVGNIGLSSGSIRFMPIYYENELDKVLEALKSSVKGTAFKSFVILETLVGHLCYRRFDNNYSRQYALLVSLKKAEPQKLEDYEAF